MSQETLTVSIREGKGRGVARRLRAQGKVPAVIYGKSGSRSLAVEQTNLRDLMRKIGMSATLIKIEDDKGGSTLSLVQELRRNPLTDRFEHLDLLEVQEGQTLSTTVPVVPVGEAFGVKTEGGTLQRMIRRISVECLADKLPEQIEVDVTDLHLKDAVHVRDLKPIEGVKFKNRPEVVVFVCTK